MVGSGEGRGGGAGRRARCWVARGVARARVAVNVLIVVVVVVVCMVTVARWIMRTLGTRGREMCAITHIIMRVRVNGGVVSKLDV